MLLQRNHAHDLGSATPPAAAAAQMDGTPPCALPEHATAQLVQSLDAARQHTSHVWRDTSAINADGTVNGYVEIAAGDVRKWEFDMRANARAIDRVMPETSAAIRSIMASCHKPCRMMATRSMCWYSARRFRAASSSPASSSA